MSKVSDEEIIDFLRKMLSISVNQEQLARPNKDFVLGIYARFLEEFGFQSLNLPDFMACGNVTNIEYMDNIIFPINVFKAIQTYVEPMGFTDINLLDILQPKRARTFRIIQCLAFFYMKYYAVKQAWMQLEGDGMKTRQRINELEQKKLEAKHLVEEKSMQFTSLNNKLAALEKEKSEIVELNKKKKQEVEELSQQFKLTKSEIMKLQNKVCELDIDISKGREKNKELEEMIVRSPQKSIQITKDLEKALEKAKNEVPIKKQQNLSIIKKLDCQKAVFISLQPSTEDISNLLIMLSDTDNQCQNLESIKQDAMDIQEKIKSIEIEDKEKQAAKHGWQSKRNNTARQFATQFTKLRELNDGLQQRVTKSSQAITKMKDKRNKVEQKLKQVEQENSQLDAKFQSVRDRYLQSYDAVALKLLEHM